MIDLRIRLDERRRDEKFAEIDRRGRAAFLEGAEAQSRENEGRPLDGGRALAGSSWSRRRRSAAARSPCTTGARTDSEQPHRAPRRRPGHVSRKYAGDDINPVYPGMTDAEFYDINNLRAAVGCTTCPGSMPTSSSPVLRHQSGRLWTTFSPSRTSSGRAGRSSERSLAGLLGERTRSFVLYTQTTTTDDPR